MGPCVFELIQQYLVLAPILVGDDGHHSGTVVTDDRTTTVLDAAEHPFVDAKLGILLPSLAFLGGYRFV